MDPSSKDHDSFLEHSQPHHSNHQPKKYYQCNDEQTASSAHQHCHHSEQSHTKDHYSQYSKHDFYLDSSMNSNCNQKNPDCRHYDQFSHSHTVGTPLSSSSLSHSNAKPKLSTSYVISNEPIVISDEISYTSLPPTLSSDISATSQSMPTTAHYPSAATTQHLHNESALNQLKQEPKSSTSVVDLTESDDDTPEIQVISVKNPPIDPIVCYGMFNTYITNINSKNIQASIQSQIDMPVLLDVRSAVEKNHRYSLHVMANTTRLELGVVDNRITQLLTPLLRAIQFQAFLPIEGIQKSHALLRTNIYGMRSIATRVGSYLLDCRIDLQTPKHNSKEYVNPQSELLANRANAMPKTYALETSAAETSLATAKSQIESMYNSLVSAEKLPEMDPSPKLSTPLYKHQRQALYFMTNREEGVETINGDSSDAASSCIGFWTQLPNGFYKNTITNEIVAKKPQPTLGGILADDMGLGKTIEVISLIVKTMPQTPVRLPPKSTKQPSIASNQFSAMSALFHHSDLFGFAASRTQENSEMSKKRKLELEFDKSSATIPTRATLIVCPLSTISNWEEQIEAHTKRNSLRVYVYHGRQKSIYAHHIAKYDIVITTYTTLANSYFRSRSQKKPDNYEDDIGEDSQSTTSTATPPLHMIYWHRIVLDEAHIIKSSTTVQARAAFLLQAQKRWCLTGTPIQNHMDDLYSLLRFLRLQPFDALANWKYYIARPIKQSTNSIGLTRLQTIMKAITLRRTKSQMMDGKPLISIPEKIDRVILLDLLPKEREIYDAIHAKGKKLFSQLESDNAVLKNYILILEVILRMRQACTHPKLCNSNDPEIRELILKKESGTSAQNPIEFLDTVNDANSLIPADGLVANNSAKADDTSLVLKTFRYTAKEVRHMLMLYRESGDDRCVTCDCVLDGVEQPIFIGYCGHLFCNDCSKVFQSEKGSACSICHTVLTSTTIQRFTGIDTATDNEESTQIKPMDEYTPIGMTVASDDWLTYPTKIIALIDSLIEVRSQTKASDLPVKSVIFSQWTKMLSLIEGPLLTHGFKFCKLVGKMVLSSRSEAMLKFKTDPSVTIMLISLRSGGVGLNLTAASRVYLMEPYWNPAVEQQAIDRVHRMGQTLPVVSIRFIVKGSIEENIQALQRKKLEMAKATFKEEDEYTENDDEDIYDDMYDDDDDDESDVRKKTQGAEVQDTAKSSEKRQHQSSISVEAKTKLQQQKQKLANLRLLFQ
ncbi:hypothetical protein BATDEDRAFT_90880 [Batrachochytrium dendrobatidis JAM81]|uniref:Uncharacterized protein n=1 Tax=Batrachochytrium dendrobatidis (strain JAM81 / FGSC 10211) TaxID=684364 RepID=F4P9G7_BATDJ|nr:uncharacterized protein BATDEDRAFT_90880 [Batrachochytrium dendrobatidis JAM81]EGF78401.1 hypothetical protein BATDEDRAFT_90880 [Batrachochytrium dendrobatidis JAM81]|eukprot:XP_006681305.1 hypothetical protein BATDEDRAFT_90880 [Batrachochytrium dendrobatidis JAM81]